MISEKYKFAYIHIPKCGGTSIEKLFTPEFIPNPHVFGYTYKKERPDLYRWTTIRNTWDRIVSCYYYGVVKINKDISFKEFVMEYISPKGTKFAYTPENRFFGRDGHMIYIMDHETKKLTVKENTPIFKFILISCFIVIITKQGIKILDNYKKHNATNHKDYRTLYKKDKMIEAVYQRYKMEIDLFGFEFDNPSKFKKNLVGKDLKI